MTVFGNMTKSLVTKPAQQNARSYFSALFAQVVTALNIQKRGFFSRYDYAGLVPETAPPYPEIEGACAARIDNFIAFLDKMDGHLELFQEDHANYGLDWSSGMFPPLDTMAAYTMVRLASPRKIIEIGSGASTKALSLALQHNDADGELICIDPDPRSPIADLPVTHAKRMLSIDDVVFASDLGTNDILFIDSSHLMFQNTDVDIQFNRIFPRLRPGVLVQVHDVFLPDPYPERWLHRNYNEQSGLIGWILAGGFEIEFPVYYVATRLADETASRFSRFPPFVRHNRGGSLWLRKK